MKRHLKAGKLHLFHGSIEQAIAKNAEQQDELFTVASLLVRAVPCRAVRAGSMQWSPLSVSVLCRCAEALPPLPMR